MQEKAKKINSLVNGAFDGILVPPVDAPVIEKYKRRMKRLALGQLEEQHRTRLLHHGDIVYVRLSLSKYPQEIQPC
jgi:hypothetical protein